MHTAANDFDGFLRLPVAHSEFMGNNAGARSKAREQFRPETFVERFEQEQCDHCGFANIGLKQVAFDEMNQMRDAGIHRILAGLLNQHRIDLNPNATRPVLPCRHDRNAAIAGSKVVHDICFLYLGKFKHRFDDSVRRGNIDNVGRTATLLERVSG